MNADTSPAERNPMAPGEALAKLFLDNAERGAHHENDELVFALRQRVKNIQALAEHPGTTEDDDPDLTAAMQRAQACGFQFTQPRAGAAWWGERVTNQWREVVYLDPAGPCNAVRCGQGPSGALFAERVCGDATSVLLLHSVHAD